MMMKKMIAGAALVATLVGSTTPALANDTETAPATVQTTTSTDTAAEVTTQESATIAEVESTAEAEVELKEVTLTPDKLFYFLKLWVEQVQLSLTRNAAARAALLEEQAQTRLAEAVALAEAGKADLAQKAMLEAKAKLVSASKEIGEATESGKDLEKLITQIEADQTRFAKAVSKIVEELPVEVKEEMEPLTTDLLVQVALAQDSVKQEEAPAEEAEQTAAEAGLEAELAGLQPRMVLVLQAMAKASGKELAEVYAMYQQNPGLGNIAKELGLKMGPVQHAAQIHWKKAKAELELEHEKEEAEDEAVVEVEALIPTLQTTPTFEIFTKGEHEHHDHDDDDDDEDEDKKGNSKSKWGEKKEHDDHKGRGRGKGKND